MKRSLVLFLLFLLPAVTRFGFQGVDTEISEENGSLRTGVKTRGTFYEWSIHVELNFRF